MHEPPRYLISKIGQRTNPSVETGFAAELSANLPYLAASVRGTQCKSFSSEILGKRKISNMNYEALTCTACGNYSTGVSGSIDLGTTGAIGLKKKIAGTMTDLWSLSLYVSLLVTHER